MSASLREICQPFLGKNLETLGRNRGPEIDQFKRAVSPALASGYPGIPWCGAFVFWALTQLTGLPRKRLSAALGFPEPWYPESTDSWLQNARNQRRTDGAKLVQGPQPGDLFLWLRKIDHPNGKPTFDITDATHIGFILKPPIVPGARFETLEGNTCPEAGGDGRASREGNGVHIRTRPFTPSGVLFISLPPHLKDGN